MNPPGDVVACAGVVFDVDGTLVDTNYVHALCWWQAFSQFGHTVPMARIHRAVGMGGERLVSHLLGNEQEKVAGEIAKAHDVLFATWHDVVQPLPGARGLLSWCWEHRLTTVLASSAKRRDVDAMLDVLGWPDVDVVVSGEDADETKPDPDLVETALTRSGLSGEESVFVGDAVWDVEAARRAGMPCIGLTCGGTSATELREAGAVQTFEDTHALLEHWREQGQVGSFAPVASRSR